MMLVDNLIHSDLHPGNILVRLEQPHGLVGVAYKAVTALANPEGLPMKALSSALQQLGSQQGGDSTSTSSSGGVDVVAVELLQSAGSTGASAQQLQGSAGAGAASSSAGGDQGSSSKGKRGMWALVTQLRSAWSAGGPAAVLQALQSRLTGVAAGWLQPHIVLLDVGMATELSPVDQTNMIGLFRWVHRERVSVRSEATGSVKGSRHAARSRCLVLTGSAHALCARMLCAHVF
jgi:predicted unusual protein kinase regulating ubiquinone biosynthesis (AarF/ABC1/UbiB family)